MVENNSSVSLDKVFIQQRLCAIIFNFQNMNKGIEFLTDQNSLLQVGTISWPAGHVIKPHRHQPVQRITYGTSEILIVLKGVILAKFFDELNNMVQQKYIGPGNLVVLLEGAHAFDVIENCEVIEVKSGPYVGELDKVRFEV